MDKVKAILKQNALSISAFSFAVACICTGWSLVGNFDSKVSYCNIATQSCTRLTVPQWYGLPQTATEIKLVKGNGTTRTLLGVGAIVGAAASFISSLVASNVQRGIDSELNRNSHIEENRKTILVQEQQQQLEIASEFRVKDFKRELQDGYAYLMLENNPELMEQMKDKQSEPSIAPETVESTIEENKEEKPKEEEIKSMFSGITLPESPHLNENVQFWDWSWLRSRCEELPHIRIVAPTNGGKTTLADWMMDAVPCERKLVITVKRKLKQWVGLEVIGVPEDYTRVREELYGLADERKERFKLMAEGKDFPMWSVGVDEWKAINRNVKHIKADAANGVEYQPSAREVMGDNITLAREAKIRFFALAQGRQVVTWGLEGESDLEECFASFYLGQFAVDEAISYRNKQPNNSSDWSAWNKVVTHLESLGKRAVWVCCEFGKFPGIVPDLSKWQRQPLVLPTKPLVPGQPPHENVSDTYADNTTAVDEAVDDKDLWSKAIAHLNKCSELPASPQESQTPDNCPASTSESEVVADAAKPLFHEDNQNSIFVWSVKTVSEFYPDTTSEKLYQQLKMSVPDCPKARDLIRKVLKCTQGKTHPTRSYSKHGKTLFVWLANNYDDGTLRDKYLKDIKTFEKEFTNE